MRAVGFEVIDQPDVTRETMARLRLRHTGSCFLRSPAWSKRSAWRSA